MARKTRNYSFDIGTNTLTVSNQFAENAYIPGTAEYKVFKQMRKDFPGMTIIRKPDRKKNSTGLTYEKMERYISLYSNANELLPIFKTVKAIASTQKNPYRYTKDWFMKQFPNFYEMPTFENGKLYVIPFPAPENSDEKVVELGKTG